MPYNIEYRYRGDKDFTPGTLWWRDLRTARRRMKRWMSFPDNSKTYRITHMKRDGSVEVVE